MSLASSNPWPTHFDNEEPARRHNEMNNGRQPHPTQRFRPNPVRNQEQGNYPISRSTSHDANWGNVNRVGPIVGVVQPVNAVRPMPAQTVSESLVHKEKGQQRRTNAVPPHVPPRDIHSQPPPPNADFILKEKENVKPASDPWKATPEQKQYYSDEFEKLPKVQEYVDGYLCSFIEGQVAKDFFLKSKLPNEELIHIWELGDIDKDGRLTKVEFSLAFHFTLARRNNFPLPDQIPSQLYNDLIETEYIGDLNQGDSKATVEEENWETFSEKSFSTVSSASTLPKFGLPVTMGGNKAGILEPEPLRMTPNSYQISKERLSKQIPPNPYQDDMSVQAKTNSMDEKRRKYFISNAPSNGSSSSYQSSSSSSPVSDQSVGDINDSKSNLSCSSSKPLKPSSEDESGDSEIENQNSQKSCDFADFETFPTNISQQIDSISINSSQSSAKEIEHEEMVSTETGSDIPGPKVSDLPSGMTSSVTSSMSQTEQKREREIEQVRSMVVSLKERNTRLTRLNQALSIELKDLIAERVSLEARTDE